MKRTILAIIIAVIISFLIAIFSFQDLPTVMAALEFPIIMRWEMFGALAFEILLYPFTLVMAGIYFPLAGLAVAGFISGVVSKSRTRMSYISAIVLVIFFLGYFIFAIIGGIFEFSAMLSELQAMAIDLGIAYFLLFIPGIIGASLTQE